MLYVEMVRKCHMVPNPNFPGAELVSHYSWEWVIVNEKEIVKTGFKAYREAEEYLRAETYANANNKQLEMVALDWQKYKYGYWRRVGDSMECYATAKTIPAGFIPKDNALILSASSEKCGTMHYIMVRILGWDTRIRRS